MNAPLTEEQKIEARNKAETKRVFDNIKADVVEPGKDDEAKEKKDENAKTDDENVDDTTKEDIEEKEIKEEVDENKEKIEEHEKTEEELKEEIENAETQKEKEKFQKRLNREVARRKELETKLAAAEAQLAAKPDATLTEEEVARRSEALATQKEAQRDFIKTSNRLFDEAEKLDAKLETKVKDLADDIGAIPSMLVSILGDFKHGARVLNHLVNDHEEAQKYYEMSVRQPVKAAAELKELELKLAPKPKLPSKVQVNEPVGAGNRVQPAREHMGQSMEEWVRTRNARLKAEGKG